MYTFVFSYRFSDILSRRLFKNINFTPTPNRSPHNWMPRRRRRRFRPKEFVSIPKIEDLVLFKDKEHLFGILKTTTRIPVL